MQTAGDTIHTQFSLDYEILLDQEDSVGHQESHNSNSHLDGSECPPRYKQNPTKKRKLDIESSLIEFMNTPTPKTPPIVPEINPDRSFFESILLSISSFTEDQKLEFRCEILNIIKRMRSQPAVQQYGYLPNNTHYKPSHGFGLMSFNYIELNPPSRPNQCPTSNTQFRTPLSQTINTGSVFLEFLQSPHLQYLWTNTANFIVKKTVWIFLKINKIILKFRFILYVIN